MTQLFGSVALEGFEPSQAEPESDVLPLHHKAILIETKLFLVRLSCRCFRLISGAKLCVFFDTAKYFGIFF